MQAYSAIRRMSTKKRTANLDWVYVCLTKRDKFSRSGPNRAYAAPRTRTQPAVADRATGGGYGRGELGRGYPSALRAKIFRLITLIHTIPTVPARFGSIFFIQNGVYGMATVQNSVEK